MDIIEALRIIPRSLISLIALFLITKLLGKKQVSELSLFDYVIGISIGPILDILSRIYLSALLIVCVKLR